jgi:hypothetical protein
MPGNVAHAEQNENRTHSRRCPGSPLVAVRLDLQEPRAGIFHHPSKQVFWREAVSPMYRELKKRAGEMLPLIRHLRTPVDQSIVAAQSWHCAPERLDANPAASPSGG